MTAFPRSTQIHGLSSVVTVGQASGQRSVMRRRKEGPSNKALIPLINTGEDDGSVN